MRIKTLDILPSETRVVLKENIRNKIFYDKKLIARKLNLSTKTIENWIRADYRPSLEQLNELGINTKTYSFFENIDSIGINKSKHNLLLPSSIDLHKIAWMVGIVEGDRAGKKEISVGLTNENEELIKKFIDGMKEFNVNKDEIKLKIQVTKGELLNKKSFTKKFQIPIRNISVSESKIPRKNPVIQVLINRKILAHIFHEIKNMILQGETDNKTAHDFIKGFCDAEGSVNKTKRTVEIKQKNTMEGRKIIDFISKNLTLLDINNSINGPNCENMLIIRLGGGKRNISNLKRFYYSIGFSNKEKSDKLKETLL